MKMYFSLITGGFYTPTIHATMPDDVVAISDDEYAALLDGQSNGKVITSQDGKPVLSDPPPPTAEQKTAARLAELRQMLAETDYVALSDYDQTKPEIIANRQAWRDEIRKLET